MFHFENRTLTYKKEIANQFIEFVIDVGPMLASKIPTVTRYPLSYLRERNIMTRLFHPATNEEINLIIKKP